MWPDDEVVEAHAQDLVSQIGRQTVTQRLDLRDMIRLGNGLALGVDFADKLDASSK